MIQAAIGSAKMPEALRDYVNLLASKAGNYSGSRNKMAHGDQVFIDRPRSKHHGKIILLEGKETWRVDPQDDAILTLSDIQTMTENFRYLAALIADSVLNWSGDIPRRVAIWSPIVRALPNPAHAQKLNPTTASQIRSIESPVVGR
jgi:hypothetical protein